MSERPEGARASLPLEASTFKPAVPGCSVSADRPQAQTDHFSHSGARKQDSPVSPGQTRMLGPTNYPEVSPRGRPHMLHSGPTQHPAWSRFTVATQATLTAITAWHRPKDEAIQGLRDSPVLGGSHTVQSGIVFIPAHVRQSVLI